MTTRKLAASISVAVVFGVALVSLWLGLPGTHPTTYLVDPSMYHSVGAHQKLVARVQQALDSAKPGDTIELTKGLIPQDFKTRRSGTAKAPITITGPPDAVVSGKGAAHVIEINHSNIIVRGFSVNGQTGPSSNRSSFRDKLIWVESLKKDQPISGVKILNMAIANAGGECVRLRYFANHNELMGNRITNCGRYDFQFGDGGKNGEGIYIGTAPEQRGNGKNASDAVDRSDRNWIHDNVIQTNANECVDIKEGSADNLVERNDCSGQLDVDSAGLDARGSRNILRSNNIHGNAGSGVRLGGDGKKDGIDNQVYGNRIANNASGGIKIQRTPQGQICENDIFGSPDAVVGDQQVDLEPSRACDALPSTSANN